MFKIKFYYLNSNHFIIGEDNELLYMDLSYEELPYNESPISTDKDQKPNSRYKNIITLHKARKIKYNGYLVIKTCWGDQITQLVNGKLQKEVILNEFILNYQHGLAHGSHYDFDCGNIQSIRKYALNIILKEFSVSNGICTKYYNNIKGKKYLFNKTGRCVMIKIYIEGKVCGAYIPHFNKKLHRYILKFYDSDTLYKKHLNLY